MDLDLFRLRGELDAPDVLGSLLKGLGVEALATTADARRKQYAEMSGREPLVVILDNVKCASEVDLLLPPSGDAVVIAVSRGPLGLADGTALEIGLSPLPESESLELLDLLVSDGRLAEDPVATRELVRLCAGLPFALGAVGTLMRRKPLWPLSRLVAELSLQFRGKALAVAEACCDKTYKEMHPTSALLYRLLAGVPGISLTREAAAALLGLGSEACDDALQELNRAGFLDIRDLVHRENGRVYLPEWLSGHARRRSRLDAAEGEQAAAQRRLVRWVLSQGRWADRFSAGSRLIVAEEAFPLLGDPDVPLEDPEAAADPAVAEAWKLRAALWLYEERHTVFTCLRTAYERGWDDEAWMLSEPVWTFLLDHPHQTGGIELFRMAKEAAVRAGSIPAIVRTSCQLARLLWQSDRTEEADEALRQAEAGVPLLSGSDRHATLRASVVEFRGSLNGARGNWAAAVGEFEESLSMHRAIRNEYGEMLLMYRLGEARIKLDDPAAAVDLLTKAHRTAQRLGRVRMTGRTARCLGRALRLVGRTAEARGFIATSLEMASVRKSDLGAAQALDALAEVAEDEGNTQEAEVHRRAAEALRHRHGLA
ncbi:regulator [Streptomyces sp. Ncost-T6T-1]|uniref:regulator n=1 Tax=Streptomyces sp. Ncost-T6T-1 TaxID=1100828 RepID=UPI001EFBCF1A|nr:regulator [Streptomyces sp. Ncost-T6T-1]